MAQDFGKLASDEAINTTKEALTKNGINVLVVENGAEAKEKVLEMIPAGSEVMNMQSVTVNTIGLADEINKSGKYNSVRNKLVEMSARGGSALGGQKLGAAPEWVVGSVHTVTEDGKVIVASATGSQLPAYASGSSHVIWVVGAQKITKNLEEGMKRIEEYVFPLENERAMKAYGMGSGINKLFILNKEVATGRITLIIIKEKLGF